MDTIKFYPLSLADEVSALVADEEAAGFEVENLQDYNINTSWKGTTTGNQNIEFDFGASHDVKYFALNHSLSLNSFVRLYGDNSSDYSTEVAIHGAVQVVAGNSPMLLVEFPSTVDYRYYRLKMSGASAVPEIFLFYIGTPYDMSIQPSYNGFLGGISNPGGGEKVYKPIVSESAAGARFANQVMTPRRRWEYIFELITGTDYQKLTNLIDDVDGSLRPFVFQDIDETLYFVRLLNEMIGGSPRSFNLYDTAPIIMEEEF